MDFLAIILALILGAVGGYLAGRRTTAAPDTSAEREQAQLALTQARGDLAQAREDAARFRDEAMQMRADVAAEVAARAHLEAAVADARRMTAEAQSETAKVSANVAAALAQRDAAIEQVQRQAADRESLMKEFKLLSTASLEEQQKKADEVAQQRFSETAKLVQPLTDELRRMDEKIQGVEKERVRMAAELSEQVKMVQLSGEAIRRETTSLSNALRTPQVRGAWGERSLKKIVEISGLTERCDFDTQHTYTSDDGRFRPDLRVNLPAGKVIFVDSKVPLAAALDAYNTSDEAQQQAHFATFAKRVKAHIDDLSGKNYWQLELGSPEFVVLYLPSDELYRLALEKEPDLHDYATRRQIVLASPGLLIPQLQIVANGWKQVALAEQAREISNLGRELHKRISTLGNHFDAVGRGLKSAVTNYNKAVGTLETRVMPQARKFRDYEVTSEDISEISPVVDTPRDVTVPEMLEYQESQQREAELLSQ
ncbi:MAG TPA: DNA recombination protein RmuC, partial [Tessaracoccus flavescens]|nr:DNA recombination protein RmuC [Tessaracoccus flavescens]